MFAFDHDDQKEIGAAIKILFEEIAELESFKHEYFYRTIAQHINACSKEVVCKERSKDDAK